MAVLVPARKCRNLGKFNRATLCSTLGANVWLVLPADDGVFEGARSVEGIPCVHPIQVYVDLKDQPERAAEASEHLKQNPLLLGGTEGAS